MSLIDITSANSKMRCVVPAFYPGGFDFDDYSTDNMFDIGALTNTEDQMSADGKYHAGYIFNPTEQTITLMPTSNAGFLIDDWWSAERTAISKFSCNIVLTVPALGRKWQFVNGVIHTWTPTPPGRRVLQARPAVFHFESVTPSQI
ncbi:TPA: hypothetical protein SCM97_002838 [Yersinia enterocolitica]|nr:hypothetical protein [Yersinia enterocolitica]HEG1275463.1 hypothetical protein [Yersinia enterocolitica]